MMDKMEPIGTKEWQMWQIRRNTTDFRDEELFVKDVFSRALSVRDGEYTHNMCRFERVDYYFVSFV